MIIEIRARALILTGAVFAGFLGTAPLQNAVAQAPTPAIRATPSNPSLDAARAAFEALPEADRKAFQEGLIWTGDYNGVADGTFGRQTYDAIVALQVSAKKSPSGILSPWDRNDLQAAMQRAKSLTEFTVMDDPRTGIRIGIPTKMLPKQETTSTGGSRWQSADGRVTLDTRTAPPDATLQSLYERAVSIQTPGRVVSYKVLRPDFYVIAGETPTGKFYSRFASGQLGIRGFSIGYDKAMAPQFDRFVVAIANSFTPFPTIDVPAAIAQDPIPASPDPVAKRQGPRLIGTGFVTGQRQIMTTVAADSCKDMQALGVKPQQIKGKGPFLLEFDRDLDVKPAPLANGDVAEGASLLIVAFADEDGRQTLTAAPGRALGKDAFNASLQPGASGAPILDARGVLIGLVGPMPSEPRRIAGILPATSYRIVPISGLAKSFPDAVRGGRETEARNLGASAIVSSIRGMVVSIVCGM
jgi:hypothetical protein